MMTLIQKENSRNVPFQPVFHCFITYSLEQVDLVVSWKYWWHVSKMSKMLVKMSVNFMNNPKMFNRFHWNGIELCDLVTRIRLYKLKCTNLNFVCLFFFPDRWCLDELWTHRNCKNYFWHNQNHAPYEGSGKKH